MPGPKGRQESLYAFPCSWRGWEPKRKQPDRRTAKGRSRTGSQLSQPSRIGKKQKQQGRRERIVQAVGDEGVTDFSGTFTSGKRSEICVGKTSMEMRIERQLKTSPLVIQGGVDLRYVGPPRAKRVSHLVKKGECHVVSG